MWFGASSSSQWLDRTKTPFAIGIKLWKLKTWGYCWSQVTLFVAPVSIISVYIWWYHYWIALLPKLRYFKQHVWRLKAYLRWFCRYCWCYLGTWLSYILTFLFFTPWLGLLTAIPLHHNSFSEWPPRNESAMMDGPTPCPLQCRLWYGQGSAGLWWWPIYNNVDESGVTNARTCSTLSRLTYRSLQRHEIRGSAVVLAW